MAPGQPGRRLTARAEEVGRMERAELAGRIRERARLSGRFVLRSGAVSEVYWDKYRFESDPGLLDAIAAAMVGLLPGRVDRIAGLELGGVPLATALSLRSGRPALFVRKEAKAYGTANLVEGGFAAGERAVVVEDVVTSGGQVCASVQEMRALGLVVEHVLCVIDREEGGARNIAEVGCALAPLFTIGELERLADEGRRS
jgi:orotate phosphoribosyltransferase